MSKIEDDGIFIDLTTSCTVDDAVRYLLGIGPSSSNDLNESELADVDTLENLLSCILEDANTDYSNAMFAKEPADVIAAKLEKLDKAKLLIDKARQYRCDIVDELEKDGKDRKDGTSELRIDKYTTTNQKHRYITKSSLNEWALKKYGIGAPETPSTSKLQEQNDKPWLIADPNDTEPVEPWYTPARYFARQFLAENSNLNANKKMLAEKVVRLLTEHKFHPPGKKSYDPSTIRKAFSKIKF